MLLHRHNTGYNQNDRKYLVLQRIIEKLEPLIISDRTVKC